VLAALTDPQIVVAAIGGVCGLLGLVFNALLGKKAEKASAEVVAAKEAMVALQTLTIEQRAELVYKNGEIDRLHKDKARLEKDLVEEKAVNVMLSKQNEMLGGNRDQDTG
jgi:small-conductance mechanosensitive channel